MDGLCVSIWFPHLMKVYELGKNPGGLMGTAYVWKAARAATAAQMAVVNCILEMSLKIGLLMGSVECRSKPLGRRAFVIDLWVGMVFRVVTMVVMEERVLVWYDLYRWSGTGTLK